MTDSPTARDLTAELLAAIAAGKAAQAAELFADRVDFWVPHVPEVWWIPPVRTRADIEAFFDGLGRELETLRFDVDQIVGDADEVVVIGEFEQRVRRTSATFASRFALRLTVSDGAFVRYHLWEDSAAVAAAVSSSANRSAGPRTRAERIADARRLLGTEVDAWIATATSDAQPAMVPLSFAWDGTRLLLAAPASSPAGSNMARTGTVRAAVGHTRDVVMIDASARETALHDIPAETWSRYEEHTGWDPREAGEGYRAYVLLPHRMQVWREADEILGRTVMRDGKWLDEAGS